MQNDIELEKKSLNNKIIAYLTTRSKRQYNIANKNTNCRYVNMFENQNNSDENIEMRDAVETESIVHLRDSVLD